MSWATLTTRAKVLTIFIGLGVAVCSLIVGVAAAWAVIEPSWYASRAFVREEVARVATPVYGLARELRDRLKRTRDGHVARLAEAKDQQTRDDLQNLIWQDDEDIANAEARISALGRLLQRRVK